MNEQEAIAQLEVAFNGEWNRLDIGRAEVIKDFMEVAQKEGITAHEYMKRIYRGNLRAYAKTLLVISQYGQKCD